MGVFQAVGVPCPESFFGFGVGGVEPPLAILRTEIMGALVVTGKKADVARIERLAANGIDSGFRYCIRIGHGHTSFRSVC